MANAALIPADATAFKFRFHAIVQSPGRWELRSTAKRNPDAKVELFIEAQEKGAHYDFLCPDETMSLETIEDFRFQLDPANYTYESGVLTGQLDPSHSFLEQLTETVRYGGRLLFDGGQWRTCGVSGNSECLRPVPEGAVLELRLVSTRGRLNVIEYATNYGPRGRMMTIPAE